MGRLVFILIILLAPAICSCRSSRNVERQTDAGRSTLIERQRETADSLFASLRLTRHEAAGRLANMKIENTTTYYSAPDSTGRQYPVKVSETKAAGEEKESTLTDTEINATMRRIASAVDSLGRKVDESVREQEKAAELSWWDLHKQNILTVSGLVMLMAAGFLIYRLKR